MQEVSILAVNGKEIKEGTLDDNGMYCKRSWRPFEDLFSCGTKYLLLHAWDEIKDKATHIRLVDELSNTNYDILPAEAATFGEWYAWPNEKCKWFRPQSFRVPTLRWVKETNGTPTQ